MRYLFPVSILSGTIIGAGMFSLPYIFAASGFWLSALYLLFFTFVFFITHTMYADIMLRTERLPGFVLYVRRYLGGWAAVPATLATVFGIIFASAVYLVLAVSFVRLLYTAVSEAAVVYAFWLLGSAAIFLKAKRLAVLELVVGGAVIVLMSFIFFFGIFTGDFSSRAFSLFAPGSALFFLPFGPILFSLAGRSAIPSVLEYAAEGALPERAVSWIIFWGTIIPGVFYLLFVVGVWGLSDVISIDAVSGLSRAPRMLLVALGILGTASLFSTYIPLCISVKKILEADFHSSHLLAGTVVVASPILIYLLGLGFLQLVVITGGVFLALESIFIALVWNKLNTSGVKELLLTRFGTKTAYVIIGIFLVGMIAELTNIIFSP